MAKNSTVPSSKGTWTTRSQRRGTSKIRSEQAKEVDDGEVKRMYHQHADETRIQYERLTARLEALGGSTSGVKSFLAHMFGRAPKTAQIGHEVEEKTTQDLMIAYSVENAEVAMYESLITVAQEAGNHQTAELAREIQHQERATAEKIWPHIARTARVAFDRVCAEKV